MYLEVREEIPTKRRISGMERMTKTKNMSAKKKNGENVMESHITCAGQGARTNILISLREKSFRLSQPLLPPGS
jgi:hypothetical protein